MNQDERVEITFRESPTTNINYVLAGHVPVAEHDLFKWANWFQTANRHVKFTVLNRRRKISVSTVFLGIDHNWGFAGGPVLFETMVFGSSIDGMQERYCTWREAELGHAKIVARTRNARWIRRRRLPWE